MSLIHRYQNNGYNIVLDINSGCIHVVDEVTYEVLPYMEEGLDAAAIVGKLGNQFSEEDIRTSVAECEKLREEGMLFTKDVYENAIDAFTKNRQTVVKALCLHIAHDCNLAASQKKGNITEDVPLCLLRWARRHWISLSPIRAPGTIWRLTFSAASRL